jgi:exodeoxyribonuclease V alpha subunit
MTTSSLLDALYRDGHLRVIDHALAQSLRRLDPSTPDAVLAGAALASLAVSKGHAGFMPSLPQAMLDADVDWPRADEWLAQLARSRWVTTPDDGLAHSPTGAPLVLEHGLLYLRRYREYERRLAQGLRRIGAHAPAQGAPAALAPLFARLFPDAAHGDDHQARAAALALRHALLLVTGGPGTGKTTTITRVLVLLVAQANIAGLPAPRIALAAPTGRAAERMAESLRNAVQSLTALGVDAALCAQLPIAGTTLHRLLGTIPDSPRFRHHADNPLPFDVVVVDEASMIDLPLMAKLVEAVADGARLVLLGDPDQLPSVEAGDVLSGILGAAGDGSHLGPEDALALQPLLGGPVTGSHTPATATNTSPLRGRGRAAGAGAGAPGANPSAPANNEAHPPQPPPISPATATNTSPLRGRGRAAGAGEGAPGADPSPPSKDATTPTFPGRHVHLQRGYRQSASLELAPLASAVREGDSATALSLLRGNELAGVHFHEDLADPLHAQRERLLAHWTALADAATPAEALTLAGRLRLLTAVREGPQGARGLNARIEELLASRAASTGMHRAPMIGAAGNRYFHGRLLLITENSYRHRLFNGDIGICLGRAASPASGEDESGTLMAWFPGDDPHSPRPFHPAALPAHESAFAMTVHKAQGSEFDEVWLVLPARFNRVLSRELVYTGMTRARSQLHVAGSEAVIREALSRHASRWSGLGWRLGGETESAVVQLLPQDSAEVLQRPLF